MRRGLPQPVLTLTGAVLAVWLILPLIPLVIWSFARGWRFPDLLPREWSLKAWGYALSNSSGVLQSLWDTTLIALAVTCLSALIGLPAGRALGLYRFRGKALAELLILAPLIVPGLATALGLHAAFTALGLSGTRTGVIIVHLIPAMPYMILVMAAVFARFDPAYEDQARSLGAGRLAVFRHVTLPAILPGLLTASAFAFLVSWSQYVLTLLIGGGRVETLPLMLYSFAAAGRNDLTGAVSVIYILPGLLFLALTTGRLTGQGAAATGAGRP